MPPRQQVPTAWRRALTSDEAIAAALAERLGLPTGGAPSPAGPGLGVTVAVLERPRLPGVWMDTHGSVGASMQMVKGADGQDLAAPRSPGANPGIGGFLAGYKDYVGLKEFETIVDSIDKAMPSRRTCLADYSRRTEVPPEGSSVGPGATSSSAAPGPGGATSSSAAPAPGGELSASSTGAKRSSAAAAQPIQTAGRICVGLPSPRPTAAQQPPSDLPLVLVKFDDRGLLEEASGNRPPQQQQQPSTTEAAAAAAIRRALDPSAAVLLDTSSGGQLRLRVATVQPNALNLGGPFSHRGADGPQIRNRDRAAYMSAREMRPAREKNIDSKRKLRELLELPKEKLDARGQHPSRSYGLIPSQNLRVM